MIHTTYLVCYLARPQGTDAGGRSPDGLPRRRVGFKFTPLFCDVLPLRHSWLFFATNLPSFAYWFGHFLGAQSLGQSASR
jgi:hypothetical protein